jgi:uncharacterized protein (TIGR00297 family)
MTSISRGELLRKLVHMSVGLIAFALRYLGPLGAAACALAAVIFNLLILPRVGGKALWRGSEAEKGHSLGIVLYPIAVFLLVLMLWRRLEIAAATWGVLAFGDGMASVVGMTLGRRKLPWNERKSWAGTAAYFVFGTAAATALLLWTAPGAYPVPFALAACAAATLFAALMESLPHGLDDNLGVPLVTGLLLFCLVLTRGGWGAWLADPELGRRVAIGAGVNALLAGVGWLSGGVNRSGVLAGLVLGTAVWSFVDWRGYVLLLAFFVLGTLATKIGFARKAAAGIAQADKGRRGARNALAKTLVAGAAAVFAATTPAPWPVLFGLAFAAAFATAACDTVSSEIGKAFGRHTFLVTTMRPVPRGTEGAISAEGTLAGLAAALALAGVGVATGFVGMAAWWIVPIAAFVANLLESLLGATVERRGLLDNEAVNFLNTLFGALIAAFLGWVTLA